MIPPAVQAMEHQEEVALDEAELTEGEAEADTRNKQDFRSNSPKKRWKVFHQNYQGLLRRVV